MKKFVVTLLVLLAIVSALVGVVYFTKTAGNLPHYFPGHAVGSNVKHLKHGIAFIALAVILLVGAWVFSGKKTAIDTPIKTTDTK